ncbi:hypothetical protein M501DRAFT_1035451 [Patellaria atrata CBS 101060]|uniref:Pyridoxamine 5'-phosphate oxidase N-terminal domain-containing protein n=1 Tax=Patellaria atrata CBS 101060 TaxID=1346257 RepID=A0A9P4VM37_9PEZI|nr:hypothetical protein M501DRAFT_1035451 [Patellaria atrata CBS 101060]
MPTLPEIDTNAPPAHPTESSSSLPEEVIQCLQNARFLHLATCRSQIPHISLMNYTYLPSTPWSSQPTIIMTTPPSSQKTSNLFENPRVSLLVHDWVSHRPPTLSAVEGGSPIGRATSPARSSLHNLLAGFNSAALSRISVTINGLAEILEAGGEIEKWCKSRHLENNTFEGDGGAGFGSSLFGGGQEELGDGGRGSWVEPEEVRVVVVKIKDGRISDWKGGLKDFVIEISESSRDGTGTVNGL